MLLLRWKILLRTWRPSYWETVATTLILLVWLIPGYLLKHGLRFPVGTYVALVGLIAAGATFRSKPPVLEKALWIIVITFLTVREVRNFYVADRQQADTFNNIQVA